MKTSVPVNAATPCLHFLERFVSSQAVYYATSKAFKHWTIFKKPFKVYYFLCQYIYNLTMKNIVF